MLTVEIHGADLLKHLITRSGSQAALNNNWFDFTAQFSHYYSTFISASQLKERKIEKKDVIDTLFVHA